eukprot:1304840-Amphidinium_carterae.3
MSWSRRLGYPDFGFGILEHEVSWSVLTLQEILDDTPHLSVESGWWQVGSNHLLVTRTHPTLLVALLLHRSCVLAEFSVNRVAWKEWDTFARALRHRRNGAKGNGRVKLSIVSKRLYGYLRQKKVGQQLKQCEGASLFMLSKGQPTFQSLLIGRRNREHFVGERCHGIEETTANGEGSSWYLWDSISLTIALLLLPTYQTLGPKVFNLCGAQGLQLALSQATTLMRKWYGEGTVLKTDIASAFDVVSWERIFGALRKKGVPEDMAHLVIHTQMLGYVLQWHGEQSEVVVVSTRGTRQRCKLGPVLYRIVVEEVLQPFVASWIPGPGSGLLNFLRLVTLLGKNILGLTSIIIESCQRHSFTLERLHMIEMVIAKHKTEMVCMSGPIVVPPLRTWGGMHARGPETVMVVLDAGAAGSFNHWFVSVAAVCKSSLFWGFVGAPLTAHMLEDIDRQALKFARLSAGFQRAPGQDRADLYQLRRFLCGMNLGIGRLGGVKI